MKISYEKKWNIVVLGLFFWGITDTFAQDPTGPVTLDKTGYYQHGYPNGPDNPREVRDSVMVGSTMNYLILPDKFYNKVYYDDVTNNSDYTKTNLTKSRFTWTVPSIGSAAVAVNANSTSTSPYVSITWNSPSAATPVDTIRMTETPTEYNGVVIPAGAVCTGSEVKIPVTVIPKPNVMFGLVNGARTDAGCAAIETGNSTTYPVVNFPMIPAATETGAVISKANGVVVTYTVAKDGGIESADMTAKFVSAGTDALQLPVTFSEYGSYVITIKSISDRIAVKCGVNGEISSTPANNQFTYMVLPQPQPGPVYHVPNNY